MDQFGECKHGVRATNCGICKEPIRANPPRKMTSTSGIYQGRRTPENSEDFFDHPWSEWFAMRDAGVDLLERHAKKRTTTTYKKFWSGVQAGFAGDVGKSGRQVPQLLRYIGELSNDRYALILFALVITEGDDPHPSEGFFKLAARLGLIPDGEAPEKGVEWIGMSKMQRTFWKDQVEGLYKFFAD